MAKEKVTKKVMKKKPVKAKKKRSLASGVAHIKATFNNTIITITDPHGNVVAWASAGKVNFSGSRKSSGFAATVAAQDVGKTVAGMGMKEIEVKLKGPGAGRESAIRGLASTGLIVTVIKDITPVKHNGCRPRKTRRV